MRAILCVLVLLLVSISLAGPVLTYQGRILKPDGSPVKTATSFTISITNPSGNCILWAEPFSSSMSSGDGSFSFAIGAGTRSDAGTKEFKDIFSDGVVISPNSSCPAGYTKLSSDILKLKVSFNDGTGAQSLPAMDITAVPFAIEAQKVAGVASENVVRVSDGAATPLTSSSFTELLALLSGASTKYLKNDASSGASLPRMTSDPVGLGPGDAGNVIYRTDTKEIKFWDGTGFHPLVSSSATPSLSNGQILVGSTGSAPVATTLSAGAGVTITNGPGSITISSWGAMPTGNSADDGKFLKYVHGSGWQAQAVSMADLTNGLGGSAFNISGCTSAQTMKWVSLTDQFACEDIGGLAASAITSGVLPEERGGSKWSNVAGGINYSAGNVGIGMTSSPSARLDVRGPASGGEVTRFSNSTGGSGLSVQQGAATGNTYTNLQAYNANGAGSATLVINGSGGNVGIGTANPTVKLDVAGGFRPGSAAVVTTCDATTEGTMRYNYSTHSLQYCGGSPLSWISLNGTPVVNCQGNWGSCSKTCGSGVQTYYVTTPASGGGAACPYSNGATMACNTTPCLASGDVVPGSYINLSLSDINLVGSGPNAICASPPMSFAEGRCASGYSYVQCGCVSPTSTTPGTCSSNLYVPTVCQ